MSLRIIKPPAATTRNTQKAELGTSTSGLESIADHPVRTADLLPTTTTPSYDTYLERLVKLVPAESISAYPVLAAATTDARWTKIVASLLLLLVCGVLRWHATKTDDRPQWMAVVIAMVSFVIWVSVMGGEFGLSWLLEMMRLDAVVAAVGEAERQFLAVAALLVWTILVPAFYKGDEA